MERLQSIGYNRKTDVVEAIDQRLLPFEQVIVAMGTLEEARNAITEMVVRGAPLIGVTAAYGMYLAAREDRGNDFMGKMQWAAERLKSAPSDSR